jgi:hypothetical protein
LRAFAPWPGCHLARKYDAARCTTDITRWRRKIWIEEFAANGWQYRHDATGVPIDAKGPPLIPLDPTNNPLRP